MKKIIRGGLVSLIVISLVSGCAHTQPPPPVAVDPPPGQVVSAAPEVGAPAVSPGAAEVIRLAQSGVTEEVLLAYVQNSTALFNLSADQILYLKDLGISSEVTTAMLNRDAVLRNQPQVAQAAPPAVEEPPQPTVPVEAPLTPQAVETAPPPPQVNYFYSDLSPYGAWVDLAGYGWCWQPSVVVVNRGWRPYCDGGHWVYSNCGWFWQSDYSWGWAPFHYGRWQLHPSCGWVWLPDTVWGPAWVVWRQSGAYCGWAPLPPRAVFVAGTGWQFNGVHVSVNFDFGLHANHFTFIGIHDFGEHDLRHHSLPTTEVTRIYKNTTIINNYTVNNTTIVNKGIPVERVASETRTPIPRATVREAPVSSVRTVSTRQTTVNGEQVIYRPHLTAPVRTSTPVTVQKVNEQHPVIQHTPSVAVTGQPRSASGAYHTVPRTSQSPRVEQTPTRQPNQSQPRSTPSAPRTGQPTSRVDAPRSSQSSQTEHVTTAPVHQQQSRSQQPAQRTSEAPPRLEASTRTYQPSPSAPTATQPSHDYKQPGRATPLYRTESVTPIYPVQSPVYSQTESSTADRPSRSFSTGQATHSENPHQYTPKSYPPTTETRPAPAPSHPTPAGNSQEQRDNRNPKH